MTTPPAPQGVPPRGKPGRRLGPILPGTGPAHRAWLQPLREAFHASGMTLVELHQRTGWPKSKLSELLRAAGRYPRWSFTRDVMTGLDWSGMSYEVVRLQWVQAAREANKRTAWITACLAQSGDSTLADSAAVPLDYYAFREMHQDHYTAYALAFLRSPVTAEKAVRDVFTLLLLLWPDALGSERLERYAWELLRETALERAPKDNGRPTLIEAAFDTLALKTSPDPMHQITESMTLFRAISHLPPRQLDVTVLKHLRGLTDTQIADEMGISLAAVRSTARHARRSLNALLYPQHHQGGTPR
jgi:RNA polymerase sigma factor (sigma-70 family)